MTNADDYSVVIIIIMHPKLGILVYLVPKIIDLAQKGDFFLLNYFEVILTLNF